MAYAEEGDDIQRFKITGTHVKRLDQEGTVPVTVIDREQIEFSGASSLADLIRDLSFASFGVKTKASGYRGNSGSTASFRGLPAGYVLILLNGKRFPTADINFIPISAIERVDILLDGASAIYGSDAIGGVMNFITKRGDIGTTVSTGFFLPEPFVLPKKALKFQGWRSERWAEVPKFKDSIFGFKGGEELNASLTHGWMGENYQALISVFYKKQRSVLRKDRSFGLLSPEHFSKTGSPGTYIMQDRSLKVMDGCTTIIGSGQNKGYCGFDYAQYKEFQPSVNTLGFFGIVTMDVGDDSELYAHLFSTYERSLGITAPAPNRIDLTDRRAWVAVTEGIPAGATTLIYRIVDEGGTGKREGLANKYVFDVSTGINSYLPNNWNLETSWNNSGHISLNNNKNYFKKSEMFKLENGQSVWNPNKPKDQKDAISFALYEPWSTIYYLSSILESKLDGQLLNFGDDIGALYSAVGVRLGYGYFNRDVDSVTWNKATSTSDQWGGGVAEFASGGRDFQTLYGEFVLPFNLDVLNSLELQIAGSVDRYGVDYPNLKDWKSVLKGRFITSNPKISLKWEPLDTMLIRGSWGTGFKAPSLKSVHLQQVITHPSGKDSVRCELEQVCDAVQMQVTLFGNKDLKPETANFYNIGVEATPNENLSASVDYFFYHVKNIIEAGNVAMATGLEYKTYQGSAEAQRLTQNMKLKVDPPAPRAGQAVQKIEVAYYNAWDYISNGLDFKLTALFPSENLGFTTYLHTQASYLFDIRMKEILEEDFKSKIGHWGFPVARLQMQLGVQLKSAIQMALSTRGISRYNESVDKEHASDTLLQSGVKWVKKNVLNKDVQEGVKAVYKAEEIKDKTTVLQIPDHFEFDFTISLPLSALNSHWSSKSSLLFKIENLLNSIPPESRVSGPNQRQSSISVYSLGYLPWGFYYTNGRVWKLQYTRKF